MSDWQNELDPECCDTQPPNRVVIQKVDPNDFVASLVGEIQVPSY